MTRAEIKTSVIRADQNGNCAACGGPSHGRTIEFQQVLTAAELVGVAASGTRRVDYAYCGRGRCRSWFALREERGELPHQTPSGPAPRATNGLVPPPATTGGGG